jgi:tetratricopeptide (TPR) repeat protein
MSPSRLPISIALAICLGAPAWGQVSAAAPAVAIIGVGEERQSPELQSLQEGLVHLVQSEIAGRSAARLVSRNQTALFLDELGMGAAQLTELETGQRFGSALSADFLVLVELSGERELTAAVTVTEVSSAEQVWGANFTGPAAALVLLASEIGDTLVKALDLPLAQAAAPAAGPAPMLAVLDFRSGGSAGPLDLHLADLADLLSANLSALDVPLVERQKLGAVLSELGLSASGLVRVADMAKVGKLLGAERMLDTTLIAGGSDVTLNSQLLQPETGLIVASCQVSGPAQQLPALVQELAVKLVGALHVPVTDAGRAALARQATGSLEAALHAAAGWRLGQAGQAEDAIEEYQQAIYLDPTVPWYWYGVARQYEYMRDFGNWAEALRRYFPVAEGKADPKALARMACSLASAEMWQGHAAESEAAVWLALRYHDGEHGYEYLMRALAAQQKAREARDFCESLVARRGASDPEVFGAWVHMNYWFAYDYWSAYGLANPNHNDHVVRQQIDNIYRELDLFQDLDSVAEYRLGGRYLQSLVTISNQGRPDYLQLDRPLQYAAECLELARHLTSYKDRPNTAGRAWFMVGLLEYKLGHPQEALDAFHHCLTEYPVNYDLTVYSSVGPTYGLVHYLSGRVYQDLLHDRSEAVSSYQMALSYLYPGRFEAFDTRSRLAELGQQEVCRAPWQRRFGSAGVPFAKSGRDQLMGWLYGHGYDLRYERVPPDVRRAEQGVHLIAWEGRKLDFPTSEDLRAFVAGGGSLLIYPSAQLHLEAHDPFLATSNETLELRLNWLLPAFSMHISEQLLDAEQALLSPGSADIGISLNSPPYSGIFSPLDVGEAMSLLKLRSPEDSSGGVTVGAVASIGLGKVAVVSFRDWFPSVNPGWITLPQWQTTLFEGILDWFAEDELPQRYPAVAEHWAAARSLVAVGEHGAAAQELDQVAISVPSGPDARYWAGCLLADKLGDTDGAARRWREVIASGSADTWLLRMAHLRLAVAAVRAGDERTATAELALAAGEQPDGIWGQAWVAAGDLKLAQGDHLGAARAFRRVADELGHTEERFRALFGLAHALEGQGKPEAAARVYDAIVVEFGKARLPQDMDTRWPDPWQVYYPPDTRADEPTVADAVAVARPRP